MVIQHLHVHNLHPNEQDDGPGAVLDVLSCTQQDTGHMTHGRVRAQATGTLDHLENEKVAVSETDKELWIAGRWVHALKQTFKGLGGVCVCVCVHVHVCVHVCVHVRVRA